ncbi:Asp23/Gls24 family envelope stress response protein [Ktedonosporobacter rubrisoli]|uniref:Asp23/Gls24 family envelope stress response protein n=2 Tax=Ktedonosporobacter rubrisoli TaxID=2509675 RepID=A0A4P6JV15_KTERU|nr:Asp23/Gls24 family envelope stress response protein [Ktedonosporobacter rubrisoli]
MPGIRQQAAYSPSGRRRPMAIESQAPGVVRVARQVLSTIVTNTALQIPGVLRMAQTSDQWSRLLNREMPRQGVALTVRDNVVSTDLYIVVASGVNIVEVGAAVQEEVASALEEMVGMQVREVNVYIQDVA